MLNVSYLTHFLFDGWSPKWLNKLVSFTVLYLQPFMPHSKTIQFNK